MLHFSNSDHTSKCKVTGGYYNDLMQVKFHTGYVAKGKQNLYLLMLYILYKLAFILYVNTSMLPTLSSPGVV